MTVGAAQAVQSELTWDADGRRIYTSTFKVYADQGHSPREVANASGVPTRCTPYQWPPPPDTPLDTDDWAFCKQARAALAQGGVDGGNKSLWMVTVTHETPDFNNSSRQGCGDQESPLNEPVEWGGSFLNTQETILRDKDDNAMLLTNEMQIRDQTMEVYRDTVTASLNTATIDLQQRSVATGRVNELAFWGFAARVIRLTNWEYQVMYYGPTSIPFIRHTFEFQFDPTDNWSRTIYSRDVLELVQPGDPDPKKRHSWIEVDGTKVSVPQPLDNAGKQTDTPPGHELKFDVLKDYDFTTLPIPQTLPNPPFIPPT